MSWTVPTPVVNLRTFRRKHIGFVFQKSNLIPFLSAGENVQVALELNGATPRQARRRALELLDELGRRGPRRSTCRRCSPAASSSGWPWPAPGQRTQRHPGRRTDRGVGQPPRPAGDGAVPTRRARARRRRDRGHPRPAHAGCLRYDLRDGRRNHQSRTASVCRTDAGWPRRLRAHVTPSRSRTM
jgi:hypothetical protein